MSGEPSTGRRRPGALVLALTLVAMMAAGIVFALDAVLEWPSAVLLVAVAVAGAGLAVLFTLGVRQARSSGAGVFRSVGRALRGTVRAAFDLF